jgi:hypothetical protein
MTTGRTVEAPAAIGVSFNLVLDKAGRRTLVFQTHLEQDATQVAINGMCDRMRIAADRQAAIFELVEVEEELERGFAQLEDIERLAVMVTEQSRARWEREQRRGEWNVEQLSAKERMERETHEVNTKRLHASLENLAARRDKLRTLVERDAPDVGADRIPGVPSG